MRTSIAYMLRMNGSAVCSTVTVNDLFKLFIHIKVTQKGVEIKIWLNSKEMAQTWMLETSYHYNLPQQLRTK